MTMLINKAVQITRILKVRIMERMIDQNVILATNLRNLVRKGIKNHHVSGRKGVLINLLLL